MWFLKYLMVLILIFLLLLFIIIPSIWTYNPSLLVNLKYNTISDIKIENIDKPTLFISTHELPGKAWGLDQIITCTEATKSKLKFNIISYYKEADIYTRFLKKIPIFAKYNLLYTGNKIVNKSKEKLKKGENVWMFLGKGWKNKGAYNIINGMDIQVALVRITSSDKNSNVFNRNFNIEYDILEKDNIINKSSDDIMKLIQDKLYSSETHT